jgi:hypothetical protein
MTHTRFGLPCFVASAALCIGTLKVWAAHHICSYEGSYGLQGLQVVAAPVRLVPCTRLPLLFLSAQVHPCNRTDIHDQLRCLGVHRGEEMTRRDPCRCQYTGIACPSMRHGGGCDLGQACPFAHNPLEYWLHPSRWAGGREGVTGGAPQGQHRCTGLNSPAARLLQYCTTLFASPPPPPLSAGSAPSCARMPSRVAARSASSLTTPRSCGFPASRRCLPAPCCMQPPLSQREQQALPLLPCPSA